MRDVLVSDIGMPDASGYELIRRVRALPAGKGGRVPAIALTAYTAMSDRTRALMEGFRITCRSQRNRRSWSLRSPRSLEGFRDR